MNHGSDSSNLTSAHSLLSFLSYHLPTLLLFSNDTTFIMLPKSLTALLASTSLCSAAMFPRASCARYVLIDSRGTGEPQGESEGFVSMISMVLSALPNGTRYDTVYPATADITQETTFTGSVDIERFINSGLVSCPAQKYALLGYSQGATVTNEVLHNFTVSSPQGQAIKAVVNIGNPYHLPNKTGNADDKCGSTTDGATGALVGQGTQYEIPDSWYATSKVRDICFENDQVCNGINAADLLSNAHLLYGMTASVQSCGADFLIAKLS